MPDTIIIDTSNSLPEVIVIEPGTAGAVTVNSIDASNVNFDNTGTSYVGTDVQEVLTELELSISLKGTYDADANTPDLEASLTPLTGSVSVFGSPTVTGSGTLFLTELSIGDSVDILGQIRQVQSITNDTEFIADSSYFIFGSGLTANVITAPTEVIKAGDVYAVQATLEQGADFYGQSIHTGDVLIALIDDPGDLSGWLIVQKNINDYILGLKPVPNLPPPIYLNPTTGDDFNNTGRLFSPFATAQRLQEELDRFNWGNQDPIRVILQGDATAAAATYNINGSYIDAKGSINFELDFDVPFTGNLVLNDFNIPIDIEGDITTFASIKVRNLEEDLVFSDFTIDGITGTFNESIEVDNVRGGIFFGFNVNLINTSASGTHVLFDFKNIVGDVQGSIDTFGASQTFGTLFRLENVRGFKATSPAQALTGQVIDASNANLITIDRAGLPLTGTIADSYPPVYTLDGDFLFSVPVGTGAPTSTPPDGALYVDNTAATERLYVRVNGTWLFTVLM